MSATEITSSEINAQYAAAIQAIAAKDLQIAELSKEIKRLQLLVNSIRFGAKSERRRPEEKDDGKQASLFGAVELPAAAAPEPVEQDIEVPAHKRSKRKRYTDKDGNPSHFPEHLERRDTHVKPEGAQTCEHCGADKEQISTVVTEKLQVIPAQYYVERINKPVLACPCCKQSAPVKAASPDSVLPVSVLGITFIASFLTQKFAWHLPFFRQSQMLAQLGIEIQRDVLINTAIKVALQLRVIVQYMAQQILKAELEPLAREAVERIGYFYKVERDIKELGIEGGKVSDYRKQHTLPQLNEFLAWSKKIRDTASLLPKSKLLEAFSYVINHWDGLTVYLDHGIVPISNVIIEQQIRNLKLGAKNWLFAASEVGAETVAIFNSLVCTCKMNGINIQEYLTDVLGSLNDKPASELTPIAWAKARQEN